MLCSRTAGHTALARTNDTHSVALTSGIAGVILQIVTGEIAAHA